MSSRATVMTEMIELDQITKTYTGATAPALAGVSLAIREGEFFTLLGPSGCGKTTLLRCLAGLERPDAGSLRISGRTIFDSDAGVDIGPNKRNIGMVFQSYAIWPHMTVFENVAFPLRCRGERDIQAEVRRAMEVVGLQDFSNRYSSRLSGGQQQRVALARAIVARPDVLLLDEPLSNLDAALRNQMRIELRRLHREVGITTILVTHDQDEALAMSDRIAVMSGGRILETGTPRQLYEAPATVFSAGFLGNANRLDGMIEPQSGAGMASDSGHAADTSDAGGAATIATVIGALRVARAPATNSVACFIRPEHIRIAAAPSSSPGQNEFDATMTELRYAGEYCECDVVVDGPEGAATLRARVPPGSALQPGGRCRIGLPSQSIHCIARPGG